MKIKTRPFVFFAFIILLVHISASVKAQHIQLSQQGPQTNIRGLSVVDDNIAWLSGGKGYVASTKNGGKTWKWQRIKGYEQTDFRSIKAFSAKKAIIMSSGTPALILKTIDGGVNWQLKYRNSDTSYFLDAMDFANTKHGFILGDPINNKFLLLETKNGGETWANYKYRPRAKTGEAAFAASGTCLRVYKKTICFVSGGTEANFFTNNFASDTTWYIDCLPIIHGKASQGAFSMADNYVFVGGDYTNDKSSVDVACCYNISLQSNKSYYKRSRTQPSGYQSCVEYIKNKIYLSTGTPGTNISLDAGETWSKIDSTSFNVCRKAKHGILVLLAGNNGKIGIFKP